MAYLNEQDGAGGPGMVEEDLDAKEFRSHENLTGRIPRQIDQFINGGSVSGFDPEAELYSYEPEEAEYDEEEVVGLAPLPPPELAKSLDLHDPPDFHSIDEIMTNVTEDGGVRKLLIKKGSGKPLPEGCKVWFHYVCFLEYNVVFYDSTYSRRTTQSCRLDGEFDILPGLYFAVKSMECGEVAQFKITSDYAYGRLGCPPRIPEGANIFMNVMILNFVPKDQLQTIPFMNIEERAKVSFSEIYRAAEDQRRKGNSHYTSNSFHYAVKDYRRGLNYLEEYGNVTPEEDIQRKILLSTLYTNLAQAYLKMDKAPQACNACKRGLGCGIDDHRCKIYFRFAKAKFMLNGYSDALDLVRKSLKSHADPPNEIKQFEQTILLRMKRDSEEDEYEARGLYKKMMSMHLAKKN